MSPICYLGQATSLQQIESPQYGHDRFAKKTQLSVTSDNVILVTVKDQLAVVDRWGVWGGGKDESTGQCYSDDSEGSTGCGGPVGHVEQWEGRDPLFTAT
ncbi:hypothetical protein E2C01_004042 [Portunus trituberculatus]|uniref:Uncharacterized protein n=1 Tax=Portunus trituberculatus TaxID=210409 RepID=A0A5B7CPK6_PORTR|nr:hypothetical protein [Portunus trituberculatus]